MTDHDGTRALVIGASSGIGRAVACQLLEAGATVAVAARRPDLLNDLVAQYVAPNPGHPNPGHPDAGHSVVRAFPCDVTDETATTAAIEGAVWWLGGLDLVVHAAGATPLTPLAEIGADDWHRVLATNLVGPAIVAKAVVPHLRRESSSQSARGTLVLLTSHSMDEPWPGLVPYAAAKAGLRSLARGMRGEERGVRVVTVTVGPTATPFADEWGAPAGPWMERWAAEGYLRHHVLSPDDVAIAILNAVTAGPDELEIIGRQPL